MSGWVGPAAAPLPMSRKRPWPIPATASSLGHTPHPQGRCGRRGVHCDASALPAASAVHRRHRGDEDLHPQRKRGPHQYAAAHAAAGRSCCVPCHGPPARFGARLSHPRHPQANAGRHLHHRQSAAESGRSGACALGQRCPQWVRRTFKARPKHWPWRMHFISSTRLQASKPCGPAMWSGFWDNVGPKMVMFARIGPVLQRKRMTKKLEGLGMGEGRQQLQVIPRLMSRICSATYGHVPAAVPGPRMKLRAGKGLRLLHHIVAHRNRRTETG